ncbi:MAG TPA: SprT family zinc-dependent metalloprotease [Azospirillaceae bacterium]|nr:SprT family zinc-dependent metalloprotease [Azospirillaceae bacterium]
MALAKLLRQWSGNPKPPPARPITLPGLPVKVDVRRSARASRLSLKVDAARDLVQVVVPFGVPEAEVARFVARHRDWLESRVQALPPRLSFEEGALVPILGVEHVLRHDRAHRGAPKSVPMVGGPPELRVGGEPEFLGRRVLDHLKREARRRLVDLSTEKAARLGARVKGVTVRDTRSRWGSCSADGRLSYCWRLILAPEAVLDYVVAHEVAHLREMNHSSRFWALCASLTADVDAPRAWLKANGAKLHRYGDVAGE